MKTDSGLEKYHRQQIHEFENRTTEAPVVAVPFKYETGVEPGDTLYFHHLVVINDGQNLLVRMITILWAILITLLTIKLFFLKSAKTSDTTSSGGLVTS